MADEQPEKTGKSILAEQLIRLNLEIDYNESQLNKSLDPVMSALVKKLEGVSKAAQIDKGLFGKDFFSEKVKAITGFDMSLVKGVKNLIAYGQASKDLNADNKEFYNSLNFMGKGLVKVANLWRKKSEAEKEASDQSKKTSSDIANLDEQVSRMEGMNKANNGTTLLSANLEALGPEAANAAKGVEGMTVATEEATVAIEVFASVATLGLAAVVAAVLLITKTVYQMVMQAVVARAEFKKFDQMFGGVGTAGVALGIKQLGDLNKQLWTLGYSMEKVNEVVFNATSQGLAFSRAIDTKLVGSILELSGAAGIAADQVGELYTELLKTTHIEVGSIREIGNSFIAINRSIKATGVLGQVSFATFKDAISSSANALGIAANKGEAFTNKMTKDLAALATLASNLSLSVSGLNEKFEQAGSLITSGDSPFRTLLAISGGANINQMLSNSFDKTDAMLKAVTYLQGLNKSFGNNIQLTAQIAEQSLGVSKAEAIKLINMRQDSIEAIRKAQLDIAGLQTNATRDAYEKVNSGIMDTWARVKTMFSTFFQNAFGSSGGMQRLVAKMENFINNLKDKLQNSEWIDKLSRVIGVVADWIGNKLTGVLDWIEKTMNKFLDPETNVISMILKSIMNVLMLPMFMLGNMLGRGIKAAFFGDEDEMSVVEELRKKGISTGAGNPMAEQLNSPLNQKLTANKQREDELSKQSQGLEKYSPEAVTYGRSGDNVGFMTVGQKQYAIEEEKKRLAEEDLELQRNMDKNIATIAQNSGNKTGTQSTKTGPAEQASPVGLPKGYLKAAVTNQMMSFDT